MNYILYSTNKCNKTEDVALAVSTFLTFMDSISSSPEPGMMEQAYNPSSREIETDRPEVQDHS